MVTISAGDRRFIQKDEIPDSEYDSGNLMSSQLINERLHFIESPVMMREGENIEKFLRADVKEGQAASSMLHSFSPLVQASWLTMFHH